MINIPQALLIIRLKAIFILISFFGKTGNVFISQNFNPSHPIPLPAILVVITPVKNNGRKMNINLLLSIKKSEIFSVILSE